jgi:hypothetical protein
LFLTPGSVRNVARGRECWPWKQYLSGFRFIEAIL